MGTKNRDKVKDLDDVYVPRGRYLIEKLLRRHDLPLSESFQRQAADRKGGLGWLVAGYPVPQQLLNLPSKL